MSSTEVSNETGAPLVPFTFAEVKEFLASPVGSFPNCYECHDTKGADKPYVFVEDDTIYDQLINTTVARCENKKLVVPGEPENSVLHLVINGLPCGTVGKMPAGCSESEDGLVNYCTLHEDRERLRLWIEAGAPQE